MRITYPKLYSLANLLLLKELIFLFLFTDQATIHYCGSITNEPRREKTGFFAYAKTKTQISFAVTAKLISVFVFPIRIVQSLYFLNPKFQASSYLLWLYSLVCVVPGWKPRRPVFSQGGSNNITTYILCSGS